MIYTNSEMQEAIDECIHSERDRLVLKLRKIDGLTYERIAEHKDIDCTPRHISSICGRYEETLNDYLTCRKEKRRLIS